MGPTKLVIPSKFPLADRVLERVSLSSIHCVSDLIETAVGGESGGQIDQILLESESEFEDVGGQQQLAQGVPQGREGKRQQVQYEHRRVAARDLEHRHPRERPSDGLPLRVQAYHRGPTQRRAQERELGRVGAGD